MNNFREMASLKTAVTKCVADHILVFADLQKLIIAGKVWSYFELELLQIDSIPNMP